MSRASFIRTQHSNSDILKFAGRRPTIKRPYCTAIVIKVEIGLPLCIASSTLRDVSQSVQKYIVLLQVCSMSLE